MSGSDLSICIATHNRCEFLESTLRNILQQATDRVEIVVVDGASTDGTEKLMAALTDTFPNLKYFRLETNGGIDHDFNIAVERASGRYCWLMSDDDSLVPGTMARVLDAIDQGHSLVVVNSQVRNRDLRIVLQDRRLPIVESRVYPPQEHEQLFIDLANYLSFIGCVVIHRDIWLNRCRDEYLGSYFIHVGVIFQKQLPNSALIISEPLVLVRHGNASWTSRAFEIWMFKWPSLIWSFPNISEKAKAKVFLRHPWKKIKKLLSNRAKGAYSIREYEFFLRPRINNPWRSFAAKLVALTPGVVANLLMLTYCLITYPRHAIDLVDLRNSRFCPFRYR